MSFFDIKSAGQFHFFPCMQILNSNLNFEWIGLVDSDVSELRAFLTILRNHFQKLKLSELILYWELSHK